MADVQIENGYCRIANEILERIVQMKLNASQLRALLVIWRYTYGFQRKEHELSLSFIANATGCDKRQMQREITKLEKSKIITQRIKNGSHRIISFNKNYDEWITIGKSTNGENTNGESTVGENTNTSIGESTNSTIGESTNQEIKSLKTNLNTVSQLEEIPLEEVMSRSYEIEKHYCMKRGILDASAADFHEIKILMASGIPVDFVKASIDQSFKEYKPKHAKDQIRTFSYCATACYDRWSKHLSKLQPVAANNITTFSKKQNGQAYRKPSIPTTQPVVAAPSLPDEKRAEIRRVARELDQAFGNAK